MIAKAQQAFIPQGLVDDVSDFAPRLSRRGPPGVMFASKILHRLPAFNTVISNVPGPNVPIYLAGAKLLAHHPVSVVTDGIASTSRSSAIWPAELRARGPARSCLTWLT